MVGIPVNDLSCVEDSYDESPSCVFGFGVPPPFTPRRGPRDTKTERHGQAERGMDG